MDQVFQEYLFFDLMLRQNVFQGIVVLRLDQVTFVVYSMQLQVDNLLFEMLKAFQNAGYKLAIASNKPQMLLDPIVKQLFPEINFVAALGQRINTPEKPDPFIIYQIMNKCKLNGEDCLYIGDSEYDYKTAHNAGIDCAICRYGYGFYDRDWAKKATYLVDSVNELKNLLI